MNDIALRAGPALGLALNAPATVWAGSGVAIATMAIGGVIWASCDPRAGVWGPVRWRGADLSRKRVALTFDDGPTPGATDAVLEALADLHVPAAFFVIGENGRRHPQLLQKIRDQGHLIGNHSFDHSRTGYLRGGVYWDRQLADTDRAVLEATGERPMFFRAPIGVRTPRLTAAVRRAGKTQVTWSRRGLDGVERSPEYIRDRLVSGTEAGDILVLHDGVEPGRQRDPTSTIKAIPMLVAGLRERGFEFVRLDQLLELSGSAPAAVSQTR